MKPDADSPDRHMDLVSIISFIIGDRHREHSLYDVCPSTEAAIRGQLFSRTLPSNFHRCLGSAGQCTQSYPNSLWILVWDIFNTLVRKEEE